MGIKVLDKIKLGVVFGEDLKTLFSICKSEGSALPAVNCVGTDSVNAVLKQQKKQALQSLYSFRMVGANFAGKSIPVTGEVGAIIGSISGAQHIHLVAEYYGVPVVVHTDHCAKKLLPW